MYLGYRRATPPALLATSHPTSNSCTRTPPRIDRKLSLSCLRRKTGSEWKNIAAGDLENVSKVNWRLSAISCVLHLVSRCNAAQHVHYSGCEKKCAKYNLSVETLWWITSTIFKWMCFYWNIRFLSKIRTEK